MASRGNNLHEVVTPEGDKYLVSMPPKFRKSIWIKRGMSSHNSTICLDSLITCSSSSGDYIVVESIEEGNKVKAEISQILMKEQIQYIKDEGKWYSLRISVSFSVWLLIGWSVDRPSAFEDKSSSSDNDSDSEKLFKNTNRCQEFDSSSGSETDDEDCDEEEEEEKDKKSDLN